MAGNLSAAAETLVRKWLFSDASATRPTQWFLKLYTAAPSDAGGGTEVGSAGYAPQAVTFGADGAANDAEVVFGPAGAAWPAVTHGAVFDESGRFLAWAALSSPISVPNGDSLRFAVGAITNAFDRAPAMPTTLATLNLANPGFETGDMSGWTTSDASVIASPFNGDNAPHSGAYLAFAGTVTPTSFWQDKDVSAFATDIDAGQATLTGYCAWHATYGPQTDHGHLFASFLDGAGATISTAVTSDSHPDDWTLETIGATAVPSGTRAIRLGVVSIRDAGANNDNYWDDFTGPDLTASVQGGLLPLVARFRLGLTGQKDPPFDCAVAPARAWSRAVSVDAAWARAIATPPQACDGGQAPANDDLILTLGDRLVTLAGDGFKLVS